MRNYIYLSDRCSKGCILKNKQKQKNNFSQGSRSGNDVVCGVARNPQHGRQADNNSDDFSPPWVLIVLPIRDWDVLNDVKKEHSL
jgi:hypothetical protein